jgi:hypothetical protein
VLDVDDSAVHECTTLFEMSKLLLLTVVPSETANDVHE